MTVLAQIIEEAKSEDDITDVVKSIVQYMKYFNKDQININEEYKSKTALKHAISKRYGGIVEILLKAKTDTLPELNINGNALSDMIRARIDSELVDMLIGLKPDLDERSNCDNTALIIAAQLGQMWYVKTLIDAKANVNLQNVNGNTALHEIAINHKLSYFDEIGMFVDAGFDFNLRENNGYTVLMFAVYHSRSNLVKKMLELGLCGESRSEILDLAKGNHSMLELIGKYIKEEKSDQDAESKQHNIDNEKIATLTKENCELNEKVKILMEKLATIRSLCQPQSVIQPHSA